MSAKIEIPSSPIDFGRVQVNDLIFKSFLVKNTGDDILVISNMSLPSGSAFSIINSFPLSIDGLSEKYIDISFLPSGMESYSSELTITSNSENDPTVTTSIIGNGVIIFPLSMDVVSGVPSGQPGSPGGPGSVEEEEVGPTEMAPTDSWVPLTPEFPEIVDRLIQNLNEGLRKLDIAIDAARAILKILEFYITAFSSFSSLIKFVIETIKGQIDDFVENLKSTGVYINLFLPPSFFKKAQYNAQLKQMSTGGFDGFLSRLKGSIYQNTNQPLPDKPIIKTLFSVPNFNSGAIVGGMVILVDATSLDDFLQALSSLYKLIDAFDLFSIDMTPQPPINVMGTCTDIGTAAEPKLAVLLEWDPPVLNSDQWLYKVYRDTSLDNPEHYKTVSEIPKRLGGKDGIIITIKKMFSSGLSALPQRKEYEFKDDNFEPTTVTGTSFLDENIADYDSVTKTFKIKNDVKEYFYVVETVPTFSLIGLQSKAQSSPCRVTIKGCKDGANTSSIINHGDGVYEESGPASPWQLPWLSFRPLEMVPFIDVAADMLKKVLSAIAGSTEDVSSAFVKFIKSVASKIESYISLLYILKLLITSLVDLFTLPPGIYFLNLSPKTGGTDNFINRIGNAKLPGDREFSGPSGITGGLVMVYGSPSDEEVRKMGKTFSILGGLFGGKGVEVSESGQVTLSEDL